MIRRCFNSVVLAVFAAVSCAMGPASAQNGDLQSAFTRALELQSAGDFDGAIRAWREALAIDGANFGAHANLGAAYAHQGDYVSAIGEYKLALGSAPPEAIPAIRLNVGLALYKSGRLPEAAAEFEAAHRLAPAQTNALLLEADCYLRMGDFAKVIDLLTPLEAAQPDDRGATYMLGMAYVRSGQPEKGQPLIDRLIRSGDSAETHYLLGSVAFMSRDYPSATREFEVAARTDPSLPSLYSYYGRALLFSGDPDAAADAFRKQLSNDPNDFEANFQLAEILRYRKDLRGAEPLYRKAAALEPTSVPARFGAAACELARGDVEDAGPALEKLVSEAPQFADAHRLLADVYARRGRKAEASRQLALATTLEASAEPGSGIHAGAQAPDFALLSADGQARVRLSSFRGNRPAVVVFGSYTCPKFRSQVDALNRLYDRFHDRAGFLMVYIREAHGTSSWQSTANQREGVSLADARTLAEKRGYAAMCLRKLKIHYPAVVDEMNAATEKQWSAFPSRVYVIDKRGNVVFNSLLDQQQFDGAALEAALKQAF